MDNDRLLENERLQIQLIRELDMEELEVEEVDGPHDLTSDDDSDSPDTVSAPYVSFNTTLASLHTYLGEIDDTYHRPALVDGGGILTLPMVDLEGVVLFPDAILPLRVIEPRMIAAVESAMGQSNTSYMIAVVRVEHQSVSRGFRFARPQFSRIGTTAEIRQFKRLEDGSLNVVARGQQRFHLRRCWVDVDFVPCAEVQIVIEDEPMRTPREAFAKLASIPNPSHVQRLPTGPFPTEPSPEKRPYEYEEHEREERPSDTSMMNYQSLASSSSDDDLDHEGKDKLKKPESSPECRVTTPERCSEVQGRKGSYQAPLTLWPRWVYQMYDSFTLARRAADLWKQIIGVPPMDWLVRTPDLLSFHIASKLPLSESTRQELLEINGTSYRLRREIELLERFDRVRCKSCQTLIGRRTDMLVMSADGPLNAYANPGGYVHEIMTLTRASGLALVGSAVKEHSWFPGYAWTITRCATCESYMGWLFTATGPRLRPRSFWGIRSSQILDDADNLSHHS